MEETKACLICAVLDGEGAARLTDLSLVPDDSADLVWIHLNGRHPDARKYLRDRMRLDPLIVKALLAEETRPRLEELGDNTLMILRGVNFNPGPSPEDLVSIRIWISKNKIITVARRRSQAVADVEARLKSGSGPRKAGEFIAMLCNALCDTIEPALAELEDSIDLLEEKSLDTPETGMRNDISSVRKQAILFHRHLAPQRDALARLLGSQQAWVSTQDKWYLQENIDRMTRFIEDLYALRERAGVLQDELASAVSMRFNKNIQFLSVVTVIFMPLTFLTGLLGMNVSGIPHAEDPKAFGLVCAVAFLCVLVQVILFRRLKWF